MINEKVVIEEIPAAVILNKFITGEEDSNYEIFLLEYVNQSKYFQEKSMHEKYVSPKSESNGECDAISSHYKMDFKLLSSASYLQALRMTSNSVTNAIPGVTLYGVPRTIGVEYTATWTHVLFRFKKLDDLLTIRCNEDNIVPKTDDYDVLNILKTMETKKNLLLFFPYKFSIDGKIEFDTMAKWIGNFLGNDFQELSRYREKVTEGFETYILTEYNKHFLLYSISSSGFEFLESFKASLLPTYQKLWEYADPFSNIESID